METGRMDWKENFDTPKEETQKDQIDNFIKYLQDEKIVTNKHVALYWILKIAENYDGAKSNYQLKNVINEMAAYAKLGMDCLE